MTSTVGDNLSFRWSSAHPSSVEVFWEIGPMSNIFKEKTDKYSPVFQFRKQNWKLSLSLFDYYGSINILDGPVYVDVMREKPSNDAEVGHCYLGLKRSDGVEQTIGIKKFITKYQGSGWLSVQEGGWLSEECFAITPSLLKKYREAIMPRDHLALTCRITMMEGSLTVKEAFTQTEEPECEPQMRLVGRFRRIESSPVYQEFLWEIDDVRRLLDKKEEFVSPPITFRGHIGKMTFGFVDDEVLICLRMYVDESLYWSAGIVLADGTEYFTGSGQVTRRSLSTAFGSWVGPSKSILERRELVPEDVLTLSVRISLLPASGGDMSLKTEVAVNENRNKGYKEWKPTKDDLKVIQQYRQFLRSEEDRQHILRVRREEAQANIREQLRSSKDDDDDIHDLRAA